MGLWLCSMELIWALLLGVSYGSDPCKLVRAVVLHGVR
jgi:hypothetical protein